jgi:leucyl aminopeptidase (aminopeptidase T)
MLYGAMDVDWSAVSARCNSVADALKGGEYVRVTTPYGTDISFSIKGRTPMSDTGMLKGRGAFSNLPAGEVYLAPVEGTAEGVLVLEWAPGRRLASRLRVTVKGGMAAEVLGDEPYAAELTKALDRHLANRNIAELGIGTKDKASRPDNVLEAEKILGTIHLALGDNTGFGGFVAAPFHEDYVFYQPTLTLVMEDGTKEVILDSGKLML